MANKRKLMEDGTSEAGNQPSMDTSDSVAKRTRSSSASQNASQDMVGEVKTEGSVDSPKKTTGRSRGGPSGKGKKAGEMQKNKLRQKKKEDLIQQIIDMEAERERMQANRESLKARLSHSQDRRVKLQKALQVVDKPEGTKVMTDKEIRNRLLDLRRRYRDWADTYSATGHFTGDEASFGEELSYFRDSSEFADYEPLVSIVTEMEKGSYVVLTTLVSHFIYKNVIDRPFFFLEQTSSSQQLGNLETTLKDIIAGMVPPDRERRIRTWIKHTLRMLETSNPHESNKAVDEIIKMKNDFYVRATRTFLEIVPSVICRSLDEDEQKKREEILKEIMQGFGDLCLDIRCQDRWHQSIDIRCLKSELTHYGFLRHSAMYELHHTVQLKEMDNRLDKKRITFVVEPAIKGCWSIPDPTVDEETKIWAKAVVLVDGWREVYHDQVTEQPRKDTADAMGDEPNTDVSVVISAQSDAPRYEDMPDNSTTSCRNPEGTHEQEPILDDVTNSCESPLMEGVDRNASASVEQNEPPTAAIMEEENAFNELPKHATNYSLPEEAGLGELNHASAEHSPSAEFENGAAADLRVPDSCPSDEMSHEIETEPSTSAVEGWASSKQMSPVDETGYRIATDIELEGGYSNDATAPEIGAKQKVDAPEGE